MYEIGGRRIVRFWGSHQLDLQIQQGRTASKPSDQPNKPIPYHKHRIVWIRRRGNRGESIRPRPNPQANSATLPSSQRTTDSIPYHQHRIVIWTRRKVIARVVFRRNSTKTTEANFYGQQQEVGAVRQVILWRGGVGKYLDTFMRGSYCESSN